jgi:hypothetical protein
VIPTQPDPYATPPGMLPAPGGRLARATRALRHHAVRLRWEALPLLGAGIYGTAVQAYALTDPSWGEPAAFAGTSALLAAATLPLVDRQPVTAYATGAGSAACAWGCWQLAAGPSVGGSILGTVAAVAASIPYWRFIAARRDHYADQAVVVETERYRALGRTASAIPAQREAPAIEQADGARPVLPVAPWPGVPQGRSITAPIALSDRTAITLPGRHVLIGGGTDMGKSGLLHVVCCNVLACADARLLGIDMKPGAVELGIYRHAGARIASTGEAAHRLLADVSAEGERRGKEMGAVVHPDGSITLTRSWTPSADRPQWVVVIDELAELVDEVPEAADLLRSHTRLLRALGITVVSGCQITSKRVFGGDTDGRGQYSTRICVKTFDAGQTNTIMGQGSHGAGIRPDRLTAPGEFVIVSRDHDGLAVDRAYLLTNEVLAAHVQRHAATPAEHPDAEPDAFRAPAGPVWESTGTTTGDILKYLTEHTAAPADVARATGRNKDSVRALMSKLAKDGLLVSLGDGRYKAAKKGEIIAGNVVRFPGRVKA